MIFEQINFYPGAFEGRTEDEFVAAHKHQPLSEAQLREVYALANPPAEEPAKEQPAKVPRKTKESSSKEE